MSTRFRLWLVLACSFVGGVLAAASTGASGAAVATDVAPDRTYRVAIFVSNRTGPEHDTQLDSLEDYIVAAITDLGVAVISRETALHAVEQLDPGAAGNALDDQLANSTSAVRLTQALGADYVLQVSLASVGKKRNAVDAYGVKAFNDEKSVRVTYKFLDGGTGASLTADTVRAARVVQTTATAAEDNEGVLQDLLEEAARKVAASVKTRIGRGRIAAPTALAGVTKVTIRTEVADLMIPDVRIGPENTVSISESKFKVAAMAATVEVDGMAVGSAPGTFEVRPGLHKLRVTREGFVPWERTVNFTKDMQLTVAMTLSADGYARWQDATAFLNDLKNGAKLTDAAVKVLEGRAKMLEQSGFKVNVNTTEGIKFEQRSIFGL